MISIIIPVLNEVECIGDLLNHLNANTTASNISEIIVVDGGSSDGTVEIVSKIITQIDPETSSGFENPSKMVLMDSPKGRAKQMNTGAKYG